MRYFIVVGEASADLHASHLITALKELDEEATFAFMGGDLMAAAAGQPPIAHYRDVAFMGILPVLRHLGQINRTAKRVQQALLDFSPDVVIPVDFAGFNYQYILPFVKKHLSCPIHYYIAPKLWAWKPWRIKALRKYVDCLLCILPFEQEYFSSRGVQSYYVGNPCVEATLDASDEQVPLGQQIALLAGSRKQELASNLPIMLRSVQEWQSKGYKIAIAGAPGLTPADYAPYLKEYPDVELRFDDTYNIVRGSKVALVTSGTATLETALLGTPQIVLYRMGGQRIARWVFDHLFSVKYISLVNLILGREAVPELIGAEVEPKTIGRELRGLLESTKAYELQLSAIQTLKERLGSGSSSQQAAEIIVQQLALRQTAP